jgi:hypothetical protein
MYSMAQRNMRNNFKEGILINASNVVPLYDQTTDGRVDCRK